MKSLLSPFYCGLLYLCDLGECFILTYRFWDFHNGGLLCGYLLVGLLLRMAEFRNDLCHYPDDVTSAMELLS